MRRVNISCSKGEEATKITAANALAPRMADAVFAQIIAGCTSCHQKFRDVPLEEKAARKQAGANYHFAAEELALTPRATTGLPSVFARRRANSLFDG